MFRVYKIINFNSVLNLYIHSNGDTMTADIIFLYEPKVKYVLKFVKSVESIKYKTI